jgi:hypothetical protein
MPAAAKAIAPTDETARDNKTHGSAKGFGNSKATAGSYSPQVEAQRRRWGVETAAIRSTHARKF